MRDYTLIDRLIANADTALRTVVGRPHATGRPDPAATAVPPKPLDAAERGLAARLMRVNHAGEVAAQGLYQGQAMTARLKHVRANLARAALEENDHLVWCERRLAELGGRRSLLNPLWYAGSVALGATAGAIGDKWSLGFLVETERQVVQHLEEHRQRLPAADAKSHAVLQQMQADETQHAATAIKAGAAVLPGPVKRLMRLTAAFMTRTAYWL
jgi:ubiquinone biosynthesis monooxygenase Coq7